MRAARTAAYRCVHQLYALLLEACRDLPHHRGGVRAEIEPASARPHRGEEPAFADTYLLHLPGARERSEHNVSGAGGIGDRFRPGRTRFEQGLCDLAPHVVDRDVVTRLAH